MEKKLLFIVNPRAGKTKSRAPLFDAVSIFSKAGYLVRVAETRRHGDATELAERFGGDFDLVVCHGGDGTLNETVNGIMRLPREKRPPLSYLPGGSTNDFAAKPVHFLRSRARGAERHAPSAARPGRGRVQ